MGGIPTVCLFFFLFHNNPATAGSNDILPPTLNITFYDGSSRLSRSFYRSRPGAPRLVMSTSLPSHGSTSFTTINTDVFSCPPWYTERLRWWYCTHFVDADLHERLSRPRLTSLTNLLTKFSNHQSHSNPSISLAHRTAPTLSNRSIHRTDHPEMKVHPRSAGEIGQILGKQPH